MIRMLVVADHTVVHEGVKRMVEAAPDLYVAGEARSIHEVLVHVAAQRCDVVLLGMCRSGPSNLEVLHRLKRTHPRLPMMVLSLYAAPFYAIRVFRAGAAGYLAEDMCAEEFIRAIRQVARGERYVGAAVARDLVDEIVGDTPQLLHTDLSDREYQVLCQLGIGRTLTEIAEELRLSVKTISTYRTRILAKLHLQNTTELIHYAIQHRLVSGGLEESLVP